MAAKSITHADGGTLYRITEDRRALRFEIMRNHSLGIALGNTSGNPITFPDLPLFDAQGVPNSALVAAYTAINATTVNIPDAYSAAGFDFSGTRKFDENTGYRSCAFLTVPMKDQDGEIIGVLQLINAIDPTSGAVVPFSAAAQRMVESLASQAAIALTNRQLISQLETLLESFVRPINLAIDEKSPYTGGHIAPDLFGVFLSQGGHLRYMPQAFSIRRKSTWWRRHSDEKRHFLTPVARPGSRNDGQAMKGAPSPRAFSGWSSC